MACHLESKNVMEIYEKLKRRDPDQNEFLQAIYEILSSLEPLLIVEPSYIQVLETFFEPERTISFRVPWVDDNGHPEKITKQIPQRINRGYRVQYSSAIGPFKGGLRFHPSVNMSIMKFLACEQILKNSLTGLPLGGGKGGSDFDPKGKSDNEIKNFCQSFMTSLSKFIGKDTDVPAGDIGVGSKEIGYLFGQYKRISNSFDGSLTGKGVNWGGSELRPEATGYGAVFFLNAVLEFQGYSIENMKFCISGSGNVAQYAAMKLINLGAKVLTLSDSSGYIYKDSGFTEHDVKKVMYFKNVMKERVHSICKETENVQFYPNMKPWEVHCDAAFPCATQNEIDDHDAYNLIKGGCKYVIEGANMPTTLTAINIFHESKVIVCPAIAANAGGVAVSGYEMAQNSMRLYWTNDEVEMKLKNLMTNIFEKSREASEKYTGEKLNLVAGSHIAGFIKVADALVEQGMV